ncbi:ribosomal protein L16 Arg81 hydroxylase [Catalinimonas alkaloidigena]|uniref:cupin-like domain-containing protein n=1 Tax=Catalinimonas alkaloidigena TaxID=1075417 RepID=UPI0024051E65|nr:cupin-like domain-containing protein [Catalinimonas alkaloidigena]MDF9797675.1 ribosomal protein L16 Arg81 hydroxylase [Catalinimonas alkaloidigena]
MAIDYNHPVDIIEDIDLREFEQNYLLPQKPVILRGLLKGTKAYEEWDFGYFKKVAGDKTIGVFENRESDLDKTMKVPHHKMKFSEYLDLIASTPTDLRMHLWNIFKDCPELMDDFEFPDIKTKFLKGFPYMFFGGEGSVARMHQDIDMSNVFLTQFQGKRRVVLFSPEYSKLLYRYPLNVHTGVNVVKPDYDRYPGLQYVKGFECEIKHGDTLFMPGEYWHYIEYTEGGFGMSLRSLNPHLSKRFKGLMNISVRQGLDWTMRKALGKKWFQMKQQIADRRANAVIRKIEKNDNKELVY